MSRPLNSRAERQLALAHEVLDVRPGASEQEAVVAYLAKRKILATQEASEVAGQLEQLDRALRFIRVNQRFANHEEEPGPSPAKRRERPKRAGLVKPHGRTKRKKSSERRVGRLLIVSSLVLVTLTIFSAFQVASRFRHHFVRFDPGDTVFRVDDGERFGIILEIEQRHEFPSGDKREAYYVALFPDGKQAWISARTAQSALSTSP